MKGEAQTMKEATKKPDKLPDGIQALDFFSGILRLCVFMSRFAPVRILQL